MSEELKNTYRSIVCFKLLEIDSFPKEKELLQFDLDKISYRSCVYFVAKAAEIVDRELQLH